MAQTQTQVQTQTQTTDNLNILRWNTNGLIKNYQDFKHTLFTLQPTILCIQETHLKPNDPYTLNIHPYTLIRKDHSPPARRGGVAAYIKNNISHQNITPTINTDILAFEIYINNITITIFNCYFPPNDDFDTTQRT